MFKYLKNVVDKWYFICNKLEYLFDNFYSDEKDMAIWAYLPNPMYRRGRTYNCDYLGNKYGIEVKEELNWVKNLTTFLNGTLIMWSQMLDILNNGSSDM